MKPMLATNYQEDKLVFPLGVQPKIDGVRALNVNGSLTGRSLKPFKNLYTTAFYSRPEYSFLDGEIAAEKETHPALCRLTTSALNSIQGQPFTLWHVFDYITPETQQLGYQDRHRTLIDYVGKMQKAGFHSHLRVIPMFICANLKELLEWDSAFLDAGYEGTIIRKLDGKHKQGRSTVKEGGLLRIKRFSEEEAIVKEIIEGRENLNEAQTNELGHTYRTSHQDNQVPNGQVGSLRCMDLKTGREITVSAGAMDHSLRKHYFDNPSELLEQVIKYKCFLHGEKDLPRFPTYQSIRCPEDIS